MNVALTTERPSMVRAWLMASRPATLTAAFVPVLVGTAVAHLNGGVSWLPMWAALFGSFFIQIGTNFANDVFDYEKGADTEERLGPTRVVQAGILSAKAVRRGMVLMFVLAFLCGLYLTYVGGLWVFVLGLASIASGIAYTGGPYPLGYNGLGDIFVLIFFGFVAVCGTTYVQVLSVPSLAIWASVPVGALATAILVVNNVRDRETDVKAGKRTLAVRFGRRFVQMEYLLMLVLSYGIPAYLFATAQVGPFALLPLLTLPIALVLLRAVLVREGASLNPILAGTAKLLLLYGLLFAAGLVL